MGKNKKNTVTLDENMVGGLFHVFNTLVGVTDRSYDVVLTEDGDSVTYDVYFLDEDGEDNA